MSHPPYNLAMRLETFEGPSGLGPYERGRTLRDLVETMAGANGSWLARNPGAPSVLDVVRYEDAGDEWRDIATLLRMQIGDCKDIVAARVAELRRRGIAAVGRILMIDDPENPRTDYVYHVVTEYPAGDIARAGLTPDERQFVQPFERGLVHEDTSRILGMP